MGDSYFFSLLWEASPKADLQNFTDVEMLNTPIVMTAKSQWEGLFFLQASLSPVNVLHLF